MVIVNLTKVPGFSIAHSFNVRVDYSTAQKRPRVATNLEVEEFRLFIYFFVVVLMLSFGFR